MKVFTDSTGRPLYTVNPETGCWEWNLCCYQTNGYGQYKHGPAHRWVYERLRGPIPTGMQLDHLCRNRKCVNPDHLEPVTNAINVRRSSLAKLTFEQAAAIKHLALVEGRSYRSIAPLFNISPGLVGWIARGTGWRDTPGPVLPRVARHKQLRKGFTDEKIAIAKRMRQEGHTYKEIGDFLGVRKGHAHKLVTGIQYHRRKHDSASQTA